VAKQDLIPSFSMRALFLQSLRNVLIDPEDSWKNLMLDPEPFGT